MTITYTRPCSTASRSTALMRVCQPLPVARKCSNTSGSMRSVTLERGASDFGLPTGRAPMRTKGLTLSHSSSVKGILSGSLMAAAVMRASSSGVGQIVPGLSAGIFSILPWIRLAQANNASDVATIYEDHRVQSHPDIPQTAHARFAVVEPIIRPSDGSIPIQHGGIAKRQTVLGTIASIFGGVKFNQHDGIVVTFIIIVTPKNIFDQSANLRYPALVSKEMECQNSVCIAVPAPVSSGIFTPVSRSMAGRVADTRPLEERSPLGYTRVLNLPAASLVAPQLLPQQLPANQRQQAWICQQRLKLVACLFVERFQSLFWRRALRNQQGVLAFQASHDYQLFNGGIVPDITLGVRIGALPLRSCHPEQCHVQQIRFICIDYSGTLGVKLRRNQVRLDSIGVYPVLRFSQDTPDIPVKPSLRFFLFETLELGNQVQLELGAKPASELKGDVFVRVGAAVPSLSGHQADTTRFFHPLAGRQGEAVQTSSIFNYLEFDVVKVWVVQSLPNAQELHRVLVAQPCANQSAAPVELGSHIRQADVILFAFAVQVDGDTLYRQLFVAACHLRVSPEITSGASVAPTHLTPPAILRYSAFVSKEMECDSSGVKRYPHPSASGFFAPVMQRPMAGRVANTRPARGISPLGFTRAINLPAALQERVIALPRGFESLVKERSMTHVNIPAIAQHAHPVVEIHDGKAITLSIEVARVFGKRHDNVMDSIRHLRSDMPADRLLNFEETVITRPNPSGGEPIKSPAYHLTRDGFTLLAMGFTGKRALAFKLAYIDAFNRMEAELSGNSGQLPAQLPAHSDASDLDASIVNEIVSTTTRNIVETLHRQRKLIDWQAVIEAVQNPQSDMSFADLTGLLHACLNRLQRNIDAQAYTVIQQRAANQGISTSQVSLNA